MSKQNYAAFRNDALTFVNCVLLAPRPQRDWLSENMANAFGYLGIGVFAKILAAEERKAKTTKNEDLTAGIDTFNAAMADKAAEAENAMFEGLSGYDIVELTPVPDTAMGAYKFLFSLVNKTRKNNPINNIEDLLTQLKEPNQRAREVAVKAATNEFLTKLEAGIARQNLVKRGLEGRQAILSKQRLERWNSLRDKVLEAYHTDQVVPLAQFWPTLPAWAQYKIAITVLNNASRMVGNLHATAVELAASQASNAGEQHGQMVECVKHLQVFVQVIQANDIQGEIQQALNLNRLDPARHSIELDEVELDGDGNLIFTPELRTFLGLPQEAEQKPEGDQATGTDG